MSAPETETNHKMKAIILRIFIPIIVVLLLFISFSIGKKVATADISGEKLTYDNIQTVIAEKRSELTFLKKELEDVSEEIEDEQKDFDAVIAIISDKEKFENQTIEAKENLGKMNAQLAELNTTIEAKKKELAAIEGKLADKKK
ncbi:hypothetical protein [Bacillus sp. UMB0893]|uniref:hypothetical protein n=1 Tax=Bacillus sp. UMB0893 TaxID=2066053 RepID=UPI000C77507F|nr:hypothetical protein [Bacillus sp. UMB0893]PLR66012.1 hypothetical protein CYJ36_20295 [Bacillus sp. UMB0893]QNG60759.1 hypothetical protein H4O14_04405 [Bacillus sp. PAMC26568]